MKISLEFLVVVTAKLPQPAAGTKCVCGCVCNWQAHQEHCLKVADERTARATAICLGEQIQLDWKQTQNVPGIRIKDWQNWRCSSSVSSSYFSASATSSFLEACQTLRQTQNFSPGSVRPKNREKTKKDKSRKKMQIALLSLPNGRKREPKNAEKYQKYLFQLCIIKSFLCSIDTHTDTHKAHTVPEATKLGLIQLWPTVCDTRTFSISSSSTYITYTYIYWQYILVCAHYMAIYLTH